MQDKRRSPRTPAVQLLSFAEYSPDEVLEVLGLGATRDLSEGGVLVETPVPLPVGAEAALEFVVDGEIVRANAEVVRAVVEGKRCQLAFRFLGFHTEQDHERVRRFVEHRRSEAGTPPAELGVQVGVAAPPALPEGEAAKPAEKTDAKEKAVGEGGATSEAPPDQ